MKLFLESYRKNKLFYKTNKIIINRISKDYVFKFYDNDDIYYDFLKLSIKYDKLNNNIDRKWSFTLSSGTEIRKIIDRKKIEKFDHYFSIWNRKKKIKNILNV